MTRLKRLLGLGFLLVSALAQGQQKHELTVREAVELAYKNVIELKNAQVDYRIQEALNKETFGRALPQLTASAGAQYYMQLPAFLFPDFTTPAVYSILKEEGVSGNNGPITDVPAPVITQVSFQQPWNLALGATVQQLLFQPDVFVGLQARKTALNLSSALIEQTKERIKDSAYRRYYAILVAEKQLQFIDSSIKRLEKLYHDDSIMYKNGFAERLDLDRVQVQLNNLKSSRSYVENGVTIAYAALKLSLGLPQQDIVVLKEELTPATVKADILNTDFQYEDRAEIRTLQANKDLQQLDVKRHQLGAFPTVSLAGNYSINAQGPQFITNKSTTWINSSYIGLNVSVPLFDGFQRRYRVQQAQLRVDKIENNITEVKQVIDFQQTASRETLKSALNNLDLQERNLELALKVYHTTKLKFEQGLSSSFEVLQADTDYQQAQNNYFNALYNATIAKIAYQSSLGKLQ